MSLGWEDTIKPASPHPQIVGALTPENKRKRRFDDRRNSFVPTSVSASNTHAPASISKRFRGSSRTPVVPLRRRLEALEHRQLVELLEAVCTHRPEAASVVQRLVPAISVQRALEILADQAARVREAIPHGSGANDYAYLRVQPLVNELFSALADYTAIFMPPAEACVSRTLEFLDGAAELLHGLPRWDTPVNNTLLLRAYDEVSASWAAALRQAASVAPLGVIPDCDAQLQRHHNLSGGRMHEAMDAAASVKTEAVIPAHGGTWATAGTRAF